MLFYLLILPAMIKGNYTIGYFFALVPQFCIIHVYYSRIKNFPVFFTETPQLTKLGKHKNSKLQSKSAQRVFTLRMSTMALNSKHKSTNTFFKLKYLPGLKSRTNQTARRGITNSTTVPPYRLVHVSNGNNLNFVMKPFEFWATFDRVRRGLIHLKLSKSAAHDSNLLVIKVPIN